MRRSRPDAVLEAADFDARIQPLNELSGRPADGAPLELRVSVAAAPIWANECRHQLAISGLRHHAVK